jgi:uncharacterized membrane protein required for colicin V production
MNGLLIAVGLIFLVCMIVGYTRGFIKIVASLGATVATIVLATFLSPYVSGVLLKTVPIEEMMQEKCMEILMSNQEGVTVSDDVENSQDAQFFMIENAKLPEVFQQLLLDNNNPEIYKTLGVTTFSEYIGSYLARLIADIVSFLLTLIVVTIVVRTILCTVGFIGKLPVIGGLNRIAGGILGIGTGLIVVWVLFIIITLMYDSEIGRQCFASIAENEFLTYLYENNILMNYITKFRA